MRSSGADLPTGSVSTGGAFGLPHAATGSFTVSELPTPGRDFGSRSAEQYAHRHRSRRAQEHRVHRGDVRLHALRETPVLMERAFLAGQRERANWPSVDSVAVAAVAVAVERTERAFALVERGLAGYARKQP